MEKTLLQLVESQAKIPTLSEATRAERKFLLAAALVSLAITAGDLVPTVIPALGITLAPNDRAAIIGLLAGVLLFHLVGFTIYAIADLARSDFERASDQEKAQPILHKIQAELLQATTRARDSHGTPDDATLRAIGRYNQQLKIVKRCERSSRARLWLELHATIAIGLASVLHAIWVLRQDEFGAALSYGAGVIALSALVVAFIARWRKIRHAASVQYGRLLRWYALRLAARLKRMPPDSPKAERLKAKFARYFQAGLKHPLV